MDTLTERDEQIEKDIRKILLLHNLDKKSQVNVRVDKGWVVLDGYVREPWVRDKILKLMDSIPISFMSISKLAIVPSGKKSEVKIARNVLDNLDSNVNINVDKVTVKVDGQFVELSGDVKSWAAKEEALKAASTIPGVTEVRERLKVLG